MENIGYCQLDEQAVREYEAMAGVTRAATALAECAQYRQSPEWETALADFRRALDYLQTFPNKYRTGS